MQEERTLSNDDETLMITADLPTNSTMEQSSSGTIHRIYIRYLSEINFFYFSKRKFITWFKMKFTTAAGLNFIQAAFWFIAFILPIFVLIILLLIFRVIRYLIGLYLSCYHGKKIEFLTGFDAMHCIGPNESECLMHMHIIFDGNLDFDRVRGSLRRMCEEKDCKTGRWTHPRLRSCIHQRFGYSYLVLPEDFRLEDHVWVHGGPFPNNYEELYVELEKLYKRPIFKTITPPWYCVFFPLADNFVGLNPGPHFVMVYALHHGLSDGLAALNVSNGYLMDKSRSELSSAEFKKRKIEQWKPLSILRRFKTVFTAPMALMKYQKYEDYHALHPQILNGEKVGKLSPILSLAKIKAIKNATGTTVNDVMLSLIAGCLRSCFLRAGVEDLPPVMRLVVPVAFHDLSKPPVFENQCSFAHCAIPIHRETPLKRLMAAHKNMDEIKNSPILMFHYVMLKRMFNVLPSGFIPGLSERPKLTGMLSNLPGLLRDCSMDGSSVSSMFFFTESNFALNFMIMSWNDWFQLRIAADTAIVSNEKFLDDLIEDFMQEVDDLDKAVKNLPKNRELQGPRKDENFAGINIV